MEALYDDNLQAVWCRFARLQMATVGFVRLNVMGERLTAPTDFSVIHSGVLMGSAERKS
jgi:hypothetical protein